MPAGNLEHAKHHSAQLAAARVNDPHVIELEAGLDSLAYSEDLPVTQWI